MIVSDELLEMGLKERGYSLLDLQVIKEPKFKRVSKKQKFDNTTLRINYKKL